MKGRALVAWNLRRIRVRHGLSQERLAFDAGVDRSYVGGLERREENPIVDLLDRLARTLSFICQSFLSSQPKVHHLPSRSREVADRPDKAQFDVALVRSCKLSKRSFCRLTSEPLARPRMAARFSRQRNRG